MLKNLDRKIQEAEKNAKGLDKELSEMDKINEKVKGDVFQGQKLLHNEINKNQEINSKILNLESVLKYFIFVFFIMLIKFKKDHETVKFKTDSRI